MFKNINSILLVCVLTISCGSHESKSMQMLSSLTKKCFQKSKHVNLSNRNLKKIVSIDRFCSMSNYYYIPKLTNVCNDKIRNSNIQILGTRRWKYYNPKSFLGYLAHSSKH